MKMRKSLPTFESFSVNEAKFSIVQVVKQDGDKISGIWVQDHHGTLDSAIEKAIATEKANGNKLDYAVVDQITGATPNYDTKHGLKRLDTKRIGESVSESKLVADIKNLIKSKMGNTIDKAVSPKALGVEGYVNVDDYLKNMNISHKDNMLTIEMPSAHRSPRTVSPPTSKGVERVFTDLSKQAYDEIKKYLKSKGISNFEDESLDGNSIFLLSDQLMESKRVNENLNHAVEEIEVTAMQHDLSIDDFGKAVAIALTKSYGSGAADHFIKSFKKHI